jgi:amino acid transporter
MAAPDAFVRYRKWLVAFAVVVGLVLIVVAAVYFAEPARSLPSFFPGHQGGSNHHHVKHGIAAFVVGLACFVFAWFNTGPKRSAAGTTESG